MSDMDIDGILGEIGMDSHGEIPMESAPEAPQEEPLAPPEYEFTWNGKQIKAPVDKLTKWASQGYDYAQKMEQFNSLKSDFERQRSELEPKINRYHEVDEYATKNPDWWDHVQQSFQKRQEALNPDDPIASEIHTLKSELGELKKFREETMAQRRAMEERQKDDQLSDEIQEIQKTYSDLDWSAVDESGKTLELRVLEHAAQSGINSFRAAFRDHYHDRLMQIAATKAQADAVNERQKQSKLGLLGKTPAPVKGLQKAENIKSKSYNDLLEEGMAELGI